MLEARGLYCVRDDRVLFERLDLRVEGGQVMQVQGSNGSGKTTLLRILCGLNQDYEGEILWQGQPREQNLPGFHTGIFYLGHAPAIKKVLTPMENLRWFCASQGQGGDREILAALDQFGLRGYDEVPCFMMSAGQQRRVSLARLMLTPARLWVLDEPFTALDLKGVGELELFLASHVEAGGAVLLTTHHQLRMPCEVRALNLDERMGRVSASGEARA